MSAVRDCSTCDHNVTMHHSAQLRVSLRVPWLSTLALSLAGTPLDDAMRSDHTVVIDFLKSKGARVGKTGNVTHGSRVSHAHAPALVHPVRSDSATVRRRAL